MWLKTRWTPFHSLCSDTRNVWNMQDQSFSRPYSYPNSYWVGREKIDMRGWSFYWWLHAYIYNIFPLLEDDMKSFLVSYILRGICNTIVLLSIYIYLLFPLNIFHILASPFSLLKNICLSAVHFGTSQWQPDWARGYRSATASGTGDGVLL